MRDLLENTKSAWQALGRVRYGPTENEERSLVLRRSLYIIKELAEGDELTHENVRAIRPGLGLSPRYLDLVLGKKVKRPIQRGTPLTWDVLL